MEAAMTKYWTTAVFLGCLSISTVSFAQLSANPWIHPNDGYNREVAAQPTPDITVAPVYENTSSEGEILPVDPWARTRDTSFHSHHVFARAGPHQLLPGLAPLTPPHSGHRGYRLRSVNLPRQSLCAFHPLSYILLWCPAAE